MAATPRIESRSASGGAIHALEGEWTITHGAAMETITRLPAPASGAVTIDLSGIERLDTAGAWIIDRMRARLEQAGARAVIAGARQEHTILLEEAAFRDFGAPKSRRSNVLVDLAADTGRGVVNAGRDIYGGVSFLGEVMTALVRAIIRPRRFRPASIVYHIESFGLRALPIIILINFLVGCIVAQQGVFQLTRFGAAAFVADLVGVLVLRELAVLLTAIMVAGRTGSAITAELGSMKMREEIDALRVMGLDPIEVLVLPRVLALIVSLPLLTVVADVSGVFGGMLVSWLYGDISPDIFAARLQSTIGLNTFMVGIIKAPVMALVIAMIAVIEGFAVKGSAESLGRQVTSSVVKAIFMVIVMDGLFAMFFAAIRY